MKHWKYLKYLLRHKYYVALACFRRGLWWRAIKHDWSKFLPSEWFPYAEYFYGVKYTEEQRRQCFNVMGILLPSEESCKAAFDKAWLMHQHRNSHHWQHHVLRNDNGTTVVLEMPPRDVVEMLCDWEGAGRAINGKIDTLRWYALNRDRIQLHFRTQNIVDQELGWEPGCMNP
jgi:hypothetical protein